MGLAADQHEPHWQTILISTTEAADPPNPQAARIAGIVSDRDRAEERSNAKTASAYSCV